MTRIYQIAAGCLLGGAMALAGGIASAQELAARYEAMGRMSVDLGGTAMELVIPYDKEKDRAFAERMDIAGAFESINAVGRTVKPDGKPGSPMVQVTFLGKGGKFDLQSVELFDEQGFDAPMAMDEGGGTGKATEVSFENDHFEAVIEGTLLRLTGYSKGEPAPAEGAEPVPVTIRVSVDLKPLEE